MGNMIDLLVSMVFEPGFLKGFTIGVCFVVILHGVAGLFRRKPIAS